MKDDQKSPEALDLVTLFEGSGSTAEIEAIGIQAVLSAAGISVVMMNEASFPSLPWSVRVAQEDAARAREILEAAKAAGPAAAREGEAQQEQAEK